MSISKQVGDLKMVERERTQGWSRERLLASTLEEITCGVFYLRMRTTDKGATIHCWLCKAEAPYDPTVGLPAQHELHDDECPVPTAFDLLQEQADLEARRP
jgi:hypothetical protein